MIRSTLLKACVLPFVCSLFLVLSACGGGTIGSGTQERIYTVSGTVIDSSGNPAPGIEVQVSSSDNAVVTDENGDFKINAGSVNGEIHFELHSATLNTVAVLSGLTSEQSNISVLIEVDNIQGIVNSVELTNLEEDIPAEDQTQQDDFITQTYSGKTLNAREKPIRGVKITEARSNKASSSNADGIVSLQTRNGGGNVKFLVRYKNLKGGFTIKNVPRDRKVSVSFVVRLTIEEAGIDPGTGTPKQKLNVELSSQQFKN